MPSRYLMRMTGGLFPGDRIGPGPWPLPDRLPVPGEAGAYVKVRESQLAEDIPYVMRGAEYEWRDDITPERDVEERRCIWAPCVATWEHYHGGFPGGYDNPDDPEGPPIRFTGPDPDPDAVRDYNGAPLPKGEPNGP